MRRQKSVYQGWKGTSGLFGYSPIIKHLTDDPEGACDGFRSVLMILQFLLLLLVLVQVMWFLFVPGIQLLPEP